MSNLNKPICCLCQHKVGPDDRWWVGTQLHNYIWKYYIPPNPELVTLGERQKVAQIITYVSNKAICKSCYENLPDLNELIFKLNLGLI